MNIETITAIISTIGFPITSTIALGIFIHQNTKHQREDFKRREEILMYQINTLTNLVISLGSGKNENSSS